MDLKEFQKMWTVGAVLAHKQKMNEPRKEKRMPRPIHEIADEITADWTNVNYGARPYLDAMRDLNSINEMYGYDSAKSVVLYFLANAQTWRGETARRIKKELRTLAGLK